MKTWISMYDREGIKFRKEYTLSGYWTKDAVYRFLARRPWLKPSSISIEYI